MALRPPTPPLPAFPTRRAVRRPSVVAWQLPLVLLACLVLIVWLPHAATPQGRVAAEINTADELLTTELIFNGVFNDLTPAQCVRQALALLLAPRRDWLTSCAFLDLGSPQAALLSCRVFSEKGAAGGDDGLPNHLATPLRQLQAAARRVATVMQECKITVDTEEYVPLLHTAEPRVARGSAHACGVATGMCLRSTLT